MMPKDCSAEAPGMVCVACEERNATAVICGWPVCSDSWCKMEAWKFDEQGPVKIERHEQP